MAVRTQTAQIISFYSQMITIGLTMCCIRNAYSNYALLSMRLLAYVLALRPLAIELSCRSINFKHSVLDLILLVLLCGFASWLGYQLTMIYFLSSLGFDLVELMQFMGISLDVLKFSFL